MATPALKSLFEAALVQGPERITGPPAAALLIQAGLLSPDGKIADPSPNKTILDNGCGTGLLTSLLFAPDPTAKDLHVVASDLLPAMVEATQKRITERGWNASTKVVDTQAMDLEDNKFDYVLANFVLPSLANPGGSVDEMIRVAKPGGLIGFTNWAKVDWSHLIQTAIDTLDFPAGSPPRLRAVPFERDEVGPWHQKPYVESQLSSRPSIARESIKAEIFEFDTPLANDQIRGFFAEQTIRVLVPTMEMHGWTEEQKKTCLEGDRLLAAYKEVLKPIDTVHWGALIVTARKV